jgi:hypothetical protein
MLLFNEIPKGAIPCSCLLIHKLKLGHDSGLEVDAFTNNLIFISGNYFLSLSCHQACGLLGIRLSQPVVISHLLKYSVEIVCEDITSELVFQCIILLSSATKIMEHKV